MLDLGHERFARFKKESLHSRNYQSNVGRPKFDKLDLINSNVDLFTYLI